MKHFCFLEFCQLCRFIKICHGKILFQVPDKHYFSYISYYFLLYKHKYNKFNPNTILKDYLYFPFRPSSVLNRSVTGPCVCRWNSLRKFS